MGRASLINGLVATGAGVVSNQLVSSTSNFGSPFLLSGTILVLAWFVIARTWQENYGSSAAEAGTQNISIFQIERLAKAWRIARQGAIIHIGEPSCLLSIFPDRVLLVLGLTQTCFEGSMYLFVFLWVPSLQEASHSSNILPLPLGYIFSAFMISMMLGSLLYTTITSHLLTSPSKSNGSLSIHAKLSSLVCAISGLALAASVSSRNEKIRFWCFCVFEACVGIYYPVQGMLRGTLIPNEHRATVRFHCTLHVPILNINISFSSFPLCFVCLWTSSWSCHFWLVSRLLGMPCSPQVLSCWDFLPLWQGLS